jgi:hypothetical protein
VNVIGCAGSNSSSSSGSGGGSGSSSSSKPGSMWQVLPLCVHLHRTHTGQTSPPLILLEESSSTEAVLGCPHRNACPPPLWLGCVCSPD